MLKLKVIINVVKFVGCGWLLGSLKLEVLYI